MNPLSIPTIHEPSFYLIPECDTEEEVAEVLHELCEEILAEQLDDWYRDTTLGLITAASMSSAAGSTTITIPS